MPSGHAPRRGSRSGAASASANSTRARHRHEGEVVAALTLSRWVASFTAARAMRRRILAFLGPTNSGKSHAAFDLLAAAPRGAYLAPLRLLAWEGQERLAERGVAASLLTGEERRADPGDTHLSATVEMADFVTPVPVAVIDEVQMLADEDRGWAWTQAVVGLPAETLVLAGAAEAEPLIRRLAGLTGETVELRRFERMVPLTPLHRRVPLARTEPGDAIVCFSRRDAFALREALIARGRPPAMVYGALGPDVRRAEAERFRDGTAPVLVATDAIGMGLNLPIRRILFAATTKYGGLGPHLIRQIAGRAGRFGHYPEGFVGVLEGEDPAPILAAIEHPRPRSRGRCGCCRARASSWRSAAGSARPRCCACSSRSPSGSAGRARTSRSRGWKTPSRSPRSPLRPGCRCRRASAISAVRPICAIAPRPRPCSPGPGGTPRPHGSWPCCRGGWWRAGGVGSGGSRRGGAGRAALHGLSLAGAEMARNVL